MDASLFNLFTIPINIGTGGMDLSGNNIMNMTTPVAQNNMNNSLRVNSQVLSILREYNTNMLQYQTIMNNYNNTVHELLRNIYSSPQSNTIETDEEFTRALYGDIFRILFRNSLNGTQNQNQNNAVNNRNLEQYYTEFTYLPIRDPSGIDADQNVICPISMEEFREGEQLCRLNRCQHTFKKEPLRRWLRNHNTCPVCRENIIL